MLRGVLRRVVSRHVERDTTRLIRGYGADALFVARAAVLSAREQHRDCHWMRVVSEVERRISYRPW